MNAAPAPCNEYADRKLLGGEPFVSVVVLAFEHEKYVRQAVESILSQRVSFKYEIIIGEDCSTDGTLNICRDLQKRHVDRIRVLAHQKNVSLGCNGNLRSVCELCRGKYVAFCEGDDYWTDENKLQLQVDYLESHPEATVCFHPVAVKWDDERVDMAICPPQDCDFAHAKPTFALLLKTNYIQTNSMVFRWNPDGRLFDDFPDIELPADWMLCLLHARAGEIGFIDRVMAVYRRHADGLWTGAMTEEPWLRRCAYRHALFYRKVDDLFGCCHRGVIRRLALGALAVWASDQTELGDQRRMQILQLYRPFVFSLFVAPVMGWAYGLLGRLFGGARHGLALLIRARIWNLVAQNRKAMREALCRHR